MWPEVSADLLTSQSTWEKRVWLVTRRGSSGDLSLRFISVVTRPGITMRYRSFFFFFLISECLLLHGDLRREDPLRKPLLLQQMIYSGDVCVNITPVQRAECDVVRLMQSWIHPRSPVAADIVFHSRPACWQRAWHPPSSCPPPRPLFHPLFFLYPPSLVPLHKHASPPPPFLPVISLSAAVISACLLCLGKKKSLKIKKKTLSQFDDIIAATHAQASMFETTSGNNCCECLCIQILLLLVSMGVQLQAAAQEVVVTMVLFRHENRNIHTDTHSLIHNVIPHSRVSSATPFCTGTLIFKMQLRFNLILWW